MSKYRGNVGNLLQHWVLCEILNTCRNHAEQVAFIDAYSMAPLATERPKIDDTAYLFDHVREHLPGELSPYEEAWCKLVTSENSGSAYPNSAKLLITSWTGGYSLLLCETDPSTAQELQTWVEHLRHSPKCAHAEVFEGDWRQRFRRGVDASGDLVLFSFDPYMLSCSSVRDPDPANMYPNDLECLAKTIQSISPAIIVQLSTYSANHANSQGAVIDAVRSRLTDSGLEIVATVRPLRKDGRHTNGQMMSIVLARGVVWANSLESLEPRFQLWQRLACARLC